MGIYDAMMLCRADVQTYCFGLAASMGAFLLGAGKRGKRHSMPNSRIMIHQPLGGASGQAVDIEIQAKEIMYHKVCAGVCDQAQCGVRSEDRSTAHGWFLMCSRHYLLNSRRRLAQHAMHGAVDTSVQRKPNVRPCGVWHTGARVPNMPCMCLCAVPPPRRPT
jgi:hypothetical protein